LKAPWPLRGTTGGFALAEALKHNRTLQDLLLRTNQLGDAGETW